MRKLRTRLACGSPDGYWGWRDGNRTAVPLGLLAIGIAWLSVLVEIAGYPISMVSVLVGLLPFLALFGRFESGSRHLDEHTGNTAKANADSVLSCAGLTALALMGSSWVGFPDDNCVPAMLMLIGLFSVARRRSNDVGNID